MAIQELGEGRLLIDLDFQHTPGLIGSYLLPEKDGGWAVVEVGPTTCHQAFLEGLAAAGITPVEVKDVFVTHIHLDHAGGLGALVDSLPKAVFHVHEVGRPHMLDTSKLVQSAARAWGPMSDQLWGPVLPVPADRLRALKGGETFALDRGASLTVIPAPGHANHHVAFFDSALAAVMTGDGAGVLLQGSTHVRPAVPPPDLDVDMLLSSLERMRSFAPRRLLFSHYGPADNAVARLEEAAERVNRWVAVAREVIQKTPTVPEIARALEEDDLALSRAEGEPAIQAQRTNAVTGYEMAAMGLLRYLTRPPPRHAGPA